MPNVTISVSDELKGEMDNFPEVSWSEICRNAISQYVAQRKNPTPAIELDLRDVRLDMYHPSGYPTFTATLRIHNKMNTDIIVDRTLFEVRFSSSKEGERSVGSGFDLNRIVVGSNSIGQTQLFLPLFREKIRSLEGKFTSTFPCTIHCIVVADGFKNPYRQDVRTEIPIDKWNEFTKMALEPYKVSPM